MEYTVLHKPNGYNGINTLFPPDSPCLSRKVLFDPLVLPLLNINLSMIDIYTPLIKNVDIIYSCLEINSFLKSLPDDVVSWLIGERDVSLRVLDGNGSLALIASLLSSSIIIPVLGVLATVVKDVGILNAIWDKKDLLILVTAFGSSRPTKKLLTCPRFS